MTQAKMLLMPSNNSKANVHYWAGKGYEIGWLLSPRDHAPQEVFPWIPYAIDNSRFAVWSKGAIWNENHFLEYCEFYADQEHKPKWIACPHVVANKKETIKEWFAWVDKLKAFDLPLAFVVQDEMKPEDVPNEADVVFVGGTFTWKWENLRIWTESFKNIHVGRVNTLRHAITCWKLGVTSADGTGWFRHPSKWAAMEKFFQIQCGEIKDPQMELFNE